MFLCRACSPFLLQLSQATPPAPVLSPTPKGLWAECMDSAFRTHSISLHMAGSDGGKGAHQLGVTSDLCTPLQEANLVVAWMGLRCCTQCLHWRKSCAHRGPDISGRSRETRKHHPYLLLPQ